jgi:hypothetical protein
MTRRGDRVMIQALTAPVERVEEFERQALAGAAYTPGNGNQPTRGVRSEAKHGPAPRLGVEAGLVFEEKLDDT